MLLLYAGCQENRTFKGKQVQFQKRAYLFMIRICMTCGAQMSSHSYEG